MPRDLIRFMQSLFLPAARNLHGGHWQPSADVYRLQDGWLIKFDLAGVRIEDVRLNVLGSRLTVQGTRRDWCIGETCHCQQMEIEYSQFERSLELPYDLELARIAIEYRDGMLLIRIHREANP